jgi:uncharacterized membrane protein YidH (DUF202 family)
VPKTWQVEHMLRVRSWQTEAELMSNNERPTEPLSHNGSDHGAVRTMMAWIRTSLSMLSFGHTIYKVIQEAHDATNIPVHRMAPRNAGVFLTVTGTLALVLETARTKQRVPAVVAAVEPTVRTGG